MKFNKNLSFNTAISILAEQFLPDFKNKITTEVEDFNETNSLSLSEFYEKYFAEIITEMLDQQRQFCANSAEVDRIVVDRANGVQTFGYCVNKESILNTKLEDKINF